MTTTVLATLLVNKFNFRYNGKRFGPGAVIRNVPADLADKLVAEHPGNIVRLETITEYTEDISKTPENTADKQAESQEEAAIEQEDTASDDSVTELPGVDPSTTVAKTSKKK
ncbi:MAG: hypothetical protein ACRDBM_00810 [Sporomusa sp.]